MSIVEFDEGGNWGTHPGENPRVKLRPTEATMAEMEGADTNLTPHGVQRGIFPCDHLSSYLPLPTDP